MIAGVKPKELKDSVAYFSNNARRLSSASVDPPPSKKSSTTVIKRVFLIDATRASDDFKGSTVEAIKITISKGIVLPNCIDSGRTSKKNERWMHGSLQIKANPVKIVK